MSAKQFATFAIGAVIGSVASWYITKKKYEKLIQEEIKSVKDAFRCESPKDKSECPTVEETEPEKTETILYKSIAENYMKPSDYNSNTIYVITPEEFGDCKDYKLVNLTYFEDEVLADDDFEIIDDPDSIIGEEALTCFGEYVDDVVHVRNETLKTDFEITLDPRLYSEVYSKYRE